MCYPVMKCWLEIHVKTQWMRDEWYEKPATKSDKPSGTGSATGFLAGFGFGGLSTTP